MRPDSREPQEVPDRKLRAFVAISLPPALIDPITQLLQEWRARISTGEVRWVQAHQLHLTLTFLGNVTGTELPRLSRALTGACAEVRSFELGLQGLGGFPDLEHPRVVWIGLSGATDRLGDLQQRVAGATRGFGDHGEDRLFHPHLTLGRVKAHGPAPRLSELLTQTRLPSLCPWRVRVIRLIQSELQPDGARHTDLACVPLAD